MTVASQARTIDEMTEKAVQALTKGRFFEADRVATQALYLARDEDEFERMAKIIPTLYEARQQRIDAAVDAERMTIVDEQFTERIELEPGCYLVRPPLVGADARRLRLLASSREIPVAVLCREPQTRAGLCPVVAISRGATIRTKVGPPADPDHPDIDWFLDAMDALGEEAVESVDAHLDSVKRIDALLPKLDAVPTYDGLHLTLEQACLEAHDAQSSEADERPPARPR
jgi:hypothetical protein